MPKYKRLISFKENTLNFFHEYKPHYVIKTVRVQINQNLVKI